MKTKLQLKRKLLTGLIMFTIALLGSMFCPAQNTQMPIWCMDNQYYSFLDQSFHNYPATPINSYMRSSYQDRNGKLLFYISNYEVYNNFGDLIGTINDPNTPLLTFLNDVEIVPMTPDLNCSRFYVFWFTATGPLSQCYLYYTIIDMTLNNGIGGINANERQVKVTNANGHYEWGGIAVSKNIPTTQNRYLYYLGYIGTQYGVCRLTVGTTISVPTMIYNTGSNHEGTWEMDLSPDGTKLAWGSPMVTSYYLIGLDANGNYLSNSFRNIATNNWSERNRFVEFSSNSQYLFFIDWQATYPFNSIIKYIDTNNPLSTPQVVSGWNPPDNKSTKLELGLDGRIWAGTSNSIQGINTSTFTVDQTKACTLPLHTLNSDFYNLSSQIDGYNYDELYQTTEPVCCQSQIAYDSYSYTATASGTWTTNSNPIAPGVNNINVEYRIIIPVGMNITIEDMTFNFGLNAKVIICPGANLTLKGTTFQGLTQCGSMWKGVEVWASSSSIIGQLIMHQSGTRRSMIADAICAVRLFQEGTPPYNYTGGDITATYSIFRNNLQGIVATSNTINPGLLLNDNIFETTTGGMKYPHLGEIAIDYINTTDDGMILIKRDTFKLASKAIISTDAKYSVSASVFSNLSIGIYATVVTPSFLSSHTIIDNIFNEVHTSIRIDGGKYDYIKGNSFNPLGGSQATNFYGIFLNGTQNFSVYDNTFNRIKYGIYCNNGVIGVIKKYNADSDGNHFMGCYRGIQTVGTNCAPDCRSGVLIKCNYFYNYQTSGEFSTAWYNGGSIFKQGEYTTLQIENYKQAGNEWHHSDTRTDVTAVTNYPFNYYHHISPSYCIPTKNSTSGMTLVQSPCVKTNTSCVAELGGGETLVSAELTAFSSSSVNEHSILPDQISMIDNTIYYYLTNNQSDSIALFLEKANSDYAKMQLLPIYIKNGSISKAQKLLNQLKISDVSTATDTDRTQKIQLLEMQLNWKKQSISPYKMSPADEFLLRDLATYNTQASVNAKSLLSMVFGDIFQIPWLNDTLANAKIINLNETADFLGNAYPNPFDNITTIKYQTPDSCNKPKLEIYDITGRLIFSYNLNKGKSMLSISSANFENGVYIYQMVIDGIIIEQKKMIVTK